MCGKREKARFKLNATGAEGRVSVEFKRPQRNGNRKKERKKIYWKKRAKSKEISNQDCIVKDDVKERTEKKIQHTIVSGMSNMRVKGRIEGTPIEWKIDTGAKRTFVSKGTFASILEKPTLGRVSATYVVADGRTLDCAGEATMVLVFGDDAFEHPVIVRDVKHNLLGEDFFKRFRCGWDHDEKSFIIKGVKVPLGGSDEEGSGRVIALESTVVPAGGKALVPSGLTGRNRTNSGEYLGVLTPERLFMERYGLAIARTLVDSKNAVIYTRIFNPKEEDVKIY